MSVVCSLLCVSAFHLTGSPSFPEDFDLASRWTNDPGATDLEDEASFARMRTWIAHATPVKEAAEQLEP
jgi:hypothetical protein